MMMQCNLLAKVKLTKSGLFDIHIFFSCSQMSLLSNFILHEAYSVNFNIVNLPCLRFSIHIFKDLQIYPLWIRKVNNQKFHNIIANFYKLTPFCHILST